MKKFFIFIFCLFCFNSFANANVLLDSNWIEKASVSDVKKAIEEGADVNAKDVFDWTPLMCASHYNKNPEVAKLLIEAGADVNAKDMYGYTPLIYVWLYSFDEDN